MKSTKAILTAVAITTALMFVPIVSADSGSCTDQYGGKVDCPENKIDINKKVAYPTNPNLFVENLTDKDASYAPGSEVEYDIAVTNNSTVNFPIVTVIDVFPSYVTALVAGPGRYEASANKLTYELSDLNAGQTVHTRVVVRLADASRFPDDIKCEIVNTATATGPGGQSDQDTSALCVRTKVMGVTTLPVAGFDDWAYMLPFLTLAVIGFGILGKGAIRP